MRYGCLEGASGNIQKAPGPINRIELYMNQMVDTNKCKQYTEISCQVRWPLAVSLRIKLPSPPMQQHIPSLDNHLQPHCFFFLEWGNFPGKNRYPPKVDPDPDVFLSDSKSKVMAWPTWYAPVSLDVALIVNCFLGKKTHPSSITFDRYPGCTSEVPKAPTGSDLTLKKKGLFRFFSIPVHIW